MKKRHLVLLIVVGFGIVFWMLYKEASAPTITKTDTVADNALAPDSPPAQKDDLIMVVTPLPNESVASPFIIKGMARGSWYFEGSFPISITDTYGAVIAAGRASAVGDWKTTEYVPFTATLSYTLLPGTTNQSAYVILKKDNPSGEAQNDNSLAIPVTLQ